MNTEKPNNFDNIAIDARSNKWMETRNSVVGTFGYMPNFQFKGTPHKIMILVRSEINSRELTR